MAARTTRLTLPSGESRSARAFDVPVIHAAPGEDALSTIVAPPPTDDDLPVMLAGPILRRVTTRQVTIWVATSIPVVIEGSVLQPSSDHSSDPATWTVLATGRVSTEEIGARLHVALVSIEGSFPLGTLLAYDLSFEATGDHLFTDEGGLVLGSSISVGHMPLPSFLVGLEGRELNLLHASCRKHHGPDDDALVEAGHHLMRQAASLHRRPSVMLHTGDQIYADDVDGTLLRGLSAASSLLLGWEEQIPDTGSVATFATADRARLVRATGLTVDEPLGAHHLLGFGEFAAMYLMSWSPALWDVRAISSACSGFTRHPEARAARRLLANIANYMMWDDHEISDDWPMTHTRFERVRGDAIGSWIIANGMAAAYVFQLRGNGTSKPAVETALRDYMDSGRHLPAAPTDRERTAHEAAVATYAQAVMAVKGFGFVAPTRPRVVFLDTRTERSLYADVGGVDHARLPGLLDAGALGRLDATLGGLDPTHPILIVSPAPVLGLAIAEEQQVREAGEPINWENDTEAWSLEPGAFHTFLTILHRHQRPVVFFSGDVHYGMAMYGEFDPRSAPDAPRLRMAQLVSSALRNRPEGVSDALLRAGVTLNTRYDGAFVDDDGRVSLVNTTAPIDAVARLHYSYQPVAYSDGFPTTFDSNNFGVVKITWTIDGEATVTQVLHGAVGQPSGPVVQFDFDAEHYDLGAEHLGMDSAGGRR